MSRIKSVLLAIVSLSLALAIGYVMQYEIGPTAPQLASEELVFSNVTATSSAAVGPLAGKHRTPEGIAPAAEMATETTPETIVPDVQTGTQEAEIVLAAVDTEATGPLEPSCIASMTADPTIGAMANIHLDAPCQANTPVTLHHGGMVFTEVTDTHGQLDLTIPALVQDAVFVAAFENGDGAVAQLNVQGISNVDRVVVQWQGETGLQLHALEFGASYFKVGHVWAESQGLPHRTDTGFLVRLGDPSQPNARLAEVYTYPTADSTQTGIVNMSVEAEVTDKNCGHEISAQTLQFHRGGELHTQDLSLALPDCAAIGQFLVLKNMVEDLKIASN